jgi:hypothetical protein
MEMISFDSLDKEHKTTAQQIRSYLNWYHKNYQTEIQFFATPQTMVKTLVVLFI